MGDDPGLSRWAQCNHEGSYNGKREEGESESRKKRTTKAELRVMQFLAKERRESARSWKRQVKEFSPRTLLTP